MRVYWKVHRNNYDLFTKFVYKEYFGGTNIENININVNKNINLIRKYYDVHNCDYLYVCHSTSMGFSGVFDLAYMQYDLQSDKWFKEHDNKYMGEYTGRKDKLKKINELANNLNFG